MDSWHDGESGDEGEDSLNDFRFGGKDATIFLVDCTPTMHEKGPGQDDDGGDTPFQLALKCVEVTLRNKVFSNPRDEMALLLYGTKNKIGPGEEAT